MTSLETLAKYGLDTSVKAIKERINGYSHFNIAKKSVLNGAEPHDNPTEEELKLYLKAENLACDLRTADLSLLCSLAEKGEELAEIKKRAEQAREVYMDIHGKPYEYVSLTSEQGANLIDYIIKGEGK